MLTAWLAEVDEFGVDGATVSVGSVAWTSEAVVKTTLRERSDVWLAEVSAFNVTAVTAEVGTTVVIASDAWLAEVNVFGVTVVDRAIFEVVAADVWFSFDVTVKNVVVSDGSLFIVDTFGNWTPLVVGSAACSAEVDDFGFTAFDVNTLFVAFNVWLAEDNSVDIIAVLALLL